MLRLPSAASQKSRSTRLVNIHRKRGEHGASVQPCQLMRRLEGGCHQKWEVHTDGDGDFQQKLACRNQEAGFIEAKMGMLDKY